MGTGADAGVDGRVPPCPPVVSSATTAIATIAPASSEANARRWGRRKTLIVRVDWSISVSKGRHIKYA